MESAISLTTSCHRIHKDMQVSVRVYDVVKTLICLLVLTQMYTHTLCTNIYIKFRLQTNDTSSASKLSLCLLSKFKNPAMITFFTCISFQQNNIWGMILQLIGNKLNVAQNLKRTIILKQQGWIVKWSIALCSCFKGDASEYTCQLQRLRRMQLEEIGQEIGGKETFLYRQNNSILFIFPLSSIQSVLKDTVMLRTTSVCRRQSNACDSTSDI